MSSTGVMDHKCKNCGAVLKFNPHDQNWVCEFCKSTFNKDEIASYEKSRGVEELTKETEAVKLDTNWEGMDVYSCPNCGAEIVADENTSATFCVYCKNTAILKNKLVGEFNPNKIIPFYKTKEDAIAAFKNIGKGKILMPKFFNNKKNIDEIRGVYIPFWLYDYNVAGNIVGEAKNISTWTSGDRQYTKVDTFAVTRGGSMSFQKIPVDGSNNFDNDTMNSIEPFDYQGLVDFNHSYLSGFLAQKYDVGKDKASEDALVRAKNSTNEVLKRDIVGYDEVIITNSNHNVSLVNCDYVLLPVWLLNIKYKNKIRTFAMNGQTGKLIGDLPIDSKRAIFVWLLSFAICMLVGSLIWYMIG